MVDRIRKGNPQNKRQAKSRSSRLPPPNQASVAAEGDDSIHGVTLTATPQSSSAANKHPSAPLSSLSSRATSTAPWDIDVTASDDRHLIASVSESIPAFYFPSPGGPLVEYWDNDVSYAPGIGPFFEPQGELAASASGTHQQHQQYNSSFSFPFQVPSDFSSRLPPSPSLIFTTASNPDTPLFQQHQQQQLPAAEDPVASAVGAQAANTVGDLTTDPSAMATTAARPRAGMKRKASSVPSPDPASFHFGHVSGSGHASSSRSSAVGIMQIPIPTLNAAPSVPQGDETVPTISIEGSKSEESKRERQGPDIVPRLSPILPAGKVFPIRIGSELFHLSGASISSDSPSYFSHYFGEQLLQSGGRANSLKTLYIDRDPKTFRDIALHLQGYHITPRDGEHYVRLFSDAQFYSLPRLTQQLFKSEIFIQVGPRPFRVPKTLFSAPGNQPNYFTLGFAHFFSTASDPLPTTADGQPSNLLRPRALLPPSVPNRDPDVFAELLRILQGYEVRVRDEAHRALLLKDARYFHFKGVEQKLLPCQISFNLARQRGEIVMRLEDLRQSGITFVADSRGAASTGGLADASRPVSPTSGQVGGEDKGFICYQRPFIDSQTYELIISISSASESTVLDPSSRRTTFYGPIRARIASLFSVIASKMGLPAMVPLGLMMMASGGGVASQPASPANSGISQEAVRVRMEQDSSVELDGQELEWESEDEEDDVNPDSWPDIRNEASGVNRYWIVTKGLWRLRMEKTDLGKMEVILCVVKMEAYTKERTRNKSRTFLTA